MEILPTNIAEVVEIRPTLHGDDRGWLMETFNERTFTELGLPAVWGQHNESLSAHAGTVRALHWQAEPAAQAKLVRCTQGAVLDVAVDLRQSSPTYLSYAAVELRPEWKNQLLVPVGFGHGYSTLADDTIVTYLMDPVHSDEHVRRMRWNDPTIGVDWRVADADAIVSEKDRTSPLLADATGLYP